MRSVSNTSRGKSTPTTGHFHTKAAKRSGTYSTMRWHHASASSETVQPKSIRSGVRMKTYQCVLQLNNMLQTSAGVTLAHFKGPSEAEMSEISAFDWKHLDVAPDQGPDMVCMDFFLCYCVGLNMTFNYDIDHATSNSGKQALKQAGLWSTAVLMAAASNAVYGSTMRNFHFYNDQNVFIVFFNEAGLSGFPFCLDNGSSMDNPWMIHGLSMDYPWIIHGLSMDNPWMIHGLSMVYPWIIHGLSLDSP